MDRQQKELVVQNLRTQFEKSSASFLVGLKGLSVVQTQKLRSELREKGGTLTVAKMRLVKRAIADKAYCDSLAPFLKDQIGIVFVSQESPSVAKILNNFAKDHESLRLVAGCLEEQVLDKQAVVKFALLPSREVLIAQVYVAIKAPLAGLVGVLNAHMLKLVLVLKQIQQKK
ncbi:MAG: 50S ribosomal protein L10 [bacterium]|nr:50S ribosomal protein L10 [bacterium]